MNSKAWIGGPAADQILAQVAPLLICAAYLTAVVIMSAAATTTLGTLSVNAFIMFSCSRSHSTDGAWVLAGACRIASTRRQAAGPEWAQQDWPWCQAGRPPASTASGVSPTQAWPQKTALSAAGRPQAGIWLTFALSSMTLACYPPRLPRPAPARRTPGRRPWHAVLCQAAA